MKYYIFIALTIFCAAGLAIIREFHLNATDEAENVTEAFILEEEEFITTEEIIDTASESQIILLQEPAPIFQVLRNFLFQARDGLLDPSLVAEGSEHEKTEKLVKLIEHSLVEATTILATHMANSPVSTTPSGIIDTFSNRQGDIPVQIKREKEKPNALSSKNKRQTAHNMVANMSTSCSNCYNNLQKCVQQCFVQHNCNDIQRNARSCPPPPSRLCNPFTPWNPVDECKTNNDCKSPLICCNDGCINKCIAGVWRS
ncbi:uncharacterized protein LOC129960580 isoform X2 [Argiope bruennichi]|uniref:uncharacterized protein LOC129960580 isoform X2 n=1 Tax=Argiope bruennichi TaxID=94029 RepID=UPI002494E738|nr:uncharacterized protein LOC129960580 isoform X2 [Argiope bruennichi]